MKVSETFVYPFPLDAVYRMQTDKGCREDAARESGAVEFTVHVRSDGGHDVVEVDRKMKADNRIPEFVRKFIGDYVHVSQVERWAPPSAGGRAGHVHVKIKGQPASMDASLVFTADGQQTRAVLDGEVKVHLPIVGKKIEPEIARAVLGGLHVDQRVGLKWLESNG